MSTARKYYFMIPEKVLDDFSFIFSQMSHIPGFSKDNVKEIITIICYHQYREEDNYWAPLKLSYLRRYVPNAELYLDELHLLGIVDKSSYYITGQLSYQYRISSAYRSKYSKARVTNPKLINRIKKVQQNYSRHSSKMYPNQNEQIRNLSIVPEVFNHIETNYSSDTDQYNYAYASVTRIETGDIYYSVDSTSGRYHSNLTNLPSTCRPFVRINGQRLTNLDVKNCQPYLSTLILTDPGKIADFARHQPFARLLRNLIIEQTEDIQRYISLVVAGELYEYLIVEFENRGYDFKTSIWDEKREKVKKLLLKILFDRNIHMPRCRRFFMELFPQVHRIFSIVRGNEKGGKFKSYERFAILLQTVEAHIILKVILPRINREHPGIIAVTIHDSIMTGIYTDHIQIVKDTMEQEFQKIVGHKPTIKIG